MKLKILCLALCLIIFTAFAAGAAEKQIYLNVRFDNLPTLDLPKNADIRGKFVEVVEDGALRAPGKSLRILAKDTEAYARFPFSHKDNKIIIEGDFKFNDFLVEKQLFTLTGTDKSANEIIKISKGGTVTAADGKKILNLTASKWVHIAVAVNFKLKQAEIYIDGSFLKTLIFSNRNINGVNAVRFSIPASDTESEMLLDNLKVYSGGVLSDDSEFPQVEYNYRTLNKTDADYAPDVESAAVHLNEDCNGYSVGNEGPWTKVDKGNTIKVSDTPSADDKSMMIEMDNGDPYMEVSFSGVTSKKIVLEARVRSDDTNAEKALFTLKDSGGGFNMVATMTLSGDIITYNNRTITKFAKKTWYDLAVVLNFEAMTSDYYVNGKKIIENLAINNQGFSDLAIVRFQCFNATGKSTLYIDNIRVYDGIAPKTPEEIGNAQVDVKGAEMFIPEKRVADRLGDAVVFIADRSYAYAGRKKITLPDAPFINDNGICMVPVRAVAEAFGGVISYDQALNEVNGDFPDGKKLKLKVNSNEMYYGGNKITLSDPAILSGGTVFAPIRAIAEKAFAQNVFYGDMGLVIISGNDNKFNAEDDKNDIKNIYNLVYYARPKADTILSDLATYSPNKLHPRILLREDDFAKIRSNYDTDPKTREWIDGIKQNVDNRIMQLPCQGYEIPDGLRLTGASQEVQSRVMQCGMLYRLFGDKKYAERAWKELQNAADFKDWNANRHFLDTGEMAAGFGIGYDWLYDYLTDEQKAKIRAAIIKHGLEPAKNAYNGIGGSAYFVTNDNNWNIICNAGVTVAALAIADEETKISGEILARGMESTEYMMSHFYPDGGWYEGVGYWGYQATYIVYYANALNSALGTDYGFYNIPGLSETGYFPIFGTGPSGGFNFHDSGEGFSNSPELFFFAKMNNDPDLAKLRLSDMETRRFSGGVKDLLWYDPDLVSEKVELPLDKKFTGVEMASFRSGWNDEDIYLGVHAGVNNVSHGNLDAGDFVLDALGERWAVDLGGDDYNLEGYFGDKRWDYYRMRAEGQNVLIINPAKGLGQALSADTKIVSFESKPQGAKAVLDLTSAYPDYAKNVKRGFKFDDNRRRITLQDEGELKSASDLMWNMHTKADVTIAEDGKTAVLSLGSKKVWLSLSGNVYGASFSVMDAVPLESSPHPYRQNQNKGIKKLVINAANVSGKFKLAVTIVPIISEENSKLEAAALSSIDEWYINDGIKEIARADLITVNGKAIDKFSANRYNYDIRQTVGDADIPEIGAVVPDNMEVLIKQIQSVPGKATVIVSEKGDPDNRAVYSISALYAPKVGLPTGYSKLNIINIDVSDEPQPENPKTSLTDGDLNTRWSADGIQTAIFDLGGVKKVSAVALAFYAGDRRTTKFDLEISKDGVTWETVFTGSSTGETSGFETVYFGEKDAEYIRIRGYGNSENTWTSISEVEIYGKV